MKEKSTIVSLCVYSLTLILIFAWTLSPLAWGDDLEVATLTHDYPGDRAIDGYEKLLHDAIQGDQSHFVHAEEVMESWRIVDDLLCVGDQCQIRTVPYVYTGGWGPMYKIDHITKWDYPA